MAVQLECAPKFEMSLEPEPPATLWPRLPASDKRLAYDLLDGFAPAGLSSSKTMLFSTRCWRGGVSPAAGLTKFPRNMNTVPLSVVLYQQPLYPSLSGSSYTP